jgi:hypothetical protein
MSPTVAPAAPPMPDSPVATRFVPGAVCNVDRVGGRAGAPVRTRAASAITHVVIHTMEGHYAHVIESWRRGGGQACFKAHYAISRAGEITQCVQELRSPAHANRANPYSVGIEHDGFGRDPYNYTEAMYLASSRLTRDICLRYGIPMDRTRIIGHDEAPGTSHGDPGGYWDWDYYIALVRWDGTPAQRPVRVVLDATGLGLWPQSEKWVSAPRGAIRHTPYPQHSLGATYFRAPPSTTEDDPAIFLAEAPVPGIYDVALWWPVLPGNNPDAGVRVLTGPRLAPAITTRVALNSRAGRARTTLALPNTPMWRSIGTVALSAGDTVWAEVSRRSTRPGNLVADGLRLLKA